MDLLDRAVAIADDLRELRHTLHREPEVGLELPRTQQTVLSALDGLPLEIATGDAVSSVTAVLRGTNQGPAVLLRADMDALPLTERVDIPFRSQIDGAMHACGHDMHTSMLVGAARLLSACQDQLAGSVTFMFQPGEEGWNGAGFMLDEGVLDAAGEHPVAAYALHVLSSQWPLGTFLCRPGPMLAASDTLRVRVRGAGGHGSAPHRAKDPIPATAEMVTSLQTFLTRSVNPFDTVVLTVGSLHAGTRRNIIPEEAEFEATVRTFRDDVREVVAAGAPRLCEGIAAGYGLDVAVEYEEEYPLTENSAHEVDFVHSVVDEVFGTGRYETAEHPMTGAEDFSRVLQRVPGAMVFLGAALTGADPQTAPNNHSPHAAFDDTVLPDGAVLLAQLALRRLAADVVKPPATAEF